MNKLSVSILICSATFLFTSQALAEKYNIGGAYECPQLPPFIKSVGLKEPAVIDTTISRLPGLVIRELSGQKRLYQARSWRGTGYVGNTVRDIIGNIYVIPVPSVSLDINPLEKRNIVYKVDAQTAQMTAFIELPLPETESQKNPFGTMGLALDCDTNSLYVSSLAGSTARESRGVIYQIDLTNGKIVDELGGVDAIGLGVFNSATQKRLYYGDARSSSVYSIRLSPKGGFKGFVKPRYELSLLDQKNGDSTQVRKIRFNFDKALGHVMSVADTEFSYRLIAETSRRYRQYHFAWQAESDTWQLDSIGQ